MRTRAGQRTRIVALQLNATAQRPYQGGDMRPSTGWHAQFADLNNDGLLDLFITKGNVEDMPDFAAYDPNNLLLGQWDGTFAEAGGQAGIASPKRGRGAAIADLNLDGTLDIIVVNRNANVSLFRSLGANTPWGHKPMGNWVEIELYEAGPNRNGVAAHLAVKAGTRTMTRSIEVGGGDASGQSGWVHVGLGTAERAEIRVKWPDGEWSHPYRVFADNFVRIERGAAAAQYWLPPPPSAESAR
jgi:enediyne biosynthesis protein E4